MQLESCLRFIILDLYWRLPSSFLLRVVYRRMWQPWHVSMFEVSFHLYRELRWLYLHLDWVRLWGDQNYLLALQKLWHWLTGSARAIGKLFFESLRLHVQSVRRHARPIYQFGLAVIYKHIQVNWGESCLSAHSACREGFKNLSSDRLLWYAI